MAGEKGPAGFCTWLPKKTRVALSDLMQLLIHAVKKLRACSEIIVSNFRRTVKG